MSALSIFALRAINVGGTAKLPMADLRAMAADLGAMDVQTYIQSGNLVCAPPHDDDSFERALEAAIEARFGFFREVISRSAGELRAARAAHPFDVIEARSSFITLLTQAPTAGAVTKAETFECGDDRWQVIGRDLHLRYAAGAGRPQMPAAKIGKALGVPGTARNLNTIDKLLAMTESPSA